jgi:hypothetical protein
VSRLTPQQLQARRRGDFTILNEMVCPTFGFTAYRSVPDLHVRRRPITSAAEGEHATAYLLDLRIPTLIGKDNLRESTQIGIDTNVSGYPQQEPNTFVLSRPVPYSPHFREGAPVCIGEYWADMKGRVLLGHLVVHIARLLNWDEVGRGRGYVGWNGEAIAYHKKVYGNRPLNPEIAYPALPASVFAVPTGSLTPLQGPAPTGSFEAVGGNEGFAPAPPPGAGSGGFQAL